VSAKRRNVPAVVETVVPAKASTLRSALAVPAAIADAGDHAARRLCQVYVLGTRKGCILGRDCGGIQRSITAGFPAEVV
jgi:hypothetical protein